MEKFMKKAPFYLILSGLLLILSDVIQNNYFTQKDLFWNAGEITRYCDLNSIKPACDSMISLKDAAASNYSGTFMLNYRPFNLFFLILQGFFLLAELLITALVIFKAENTNSEKLSFGAVCIFALFASYKFIYLYSNNVQNVPVLYGLSAVLFSCFVFFILFKVFDLIFKNQNTAVLYTLTAVFFMYNTAFIKYYPLQTLGLLVLVSARLYNTDKLISFLKYFGSILICLCIINAGSKIFSGLNFSKIKDSSLEYKITKTPERDIWIILLDMYAGKRALDYLGYDNSAFFKELENKGFRVWDNMETNYNRTVPSISSILNINYLENIKYRTPSDAVNNAELFKMAKKSGYKIYYLNSWPMCINIEKKYINDFYVSSYYLKSSVLNLFYYDTCFKFIAEHYASNNNPILNSISYINRIIKHKGISGKKLVFAHLMMPHEPFLFNSRGEKIPQEEDNYKRIPNGGFEINKTSYLEFLQYTNKQILNIINQLLSTEKNKPVIIILGDHGIRVERYDIGKDKNHMDRIAPYHKYNFNSMLAYYNPDKNDALYDNTEGLLNFFINFANDTFGSAIENKPAKKFYVYIDGDVRNFDKLEGEAVNWNIN